MNLGRVTNELNEYLNVLMQFNPIYFSVIIVIIVVFVIYIINKNVILPSKVQYLEDKKRLQDENTRLMALFAELDPAPLVRVNPEGIIIHSNKAAEELLNRNIIGQTISSLITEASDINHIIESDSTINYNLKINNREYSVLFRGITELKMAQVYFHDITERKSYERTLKDFSHKLQNSLEEESKRIACELHDGIGQNLSLVYLKTQMLSSETDSAEYSKGLLEISHIITQAIKELKDISYNLKPRVLDEIGLEPALISLCDTISKETGIKSCVELDPIKRNLTSEEETCLYRIAQETLNNIVKHSKAKEFALRLFNLNDHLKLIISDDGIGFDYEAELTKKDTSKKMGLMSMMARAEGINAQFKIESYPGEGTVVMVDIPERKEPIEFE